MSQGNVMRREFGVCVRSGVAYELVRWYWLEIWPLPAVSRAALVDDGGPGSSIISLNELGSTIFREDSFDATTRIRRGRFYECADKIEAQSTWPHVMTHNPAMGLPLAPLHHFMASKDKPTAKLVVLGERDSVWRILGAERISTGEWLVTLKARGGAGLLPEVDADAIPAASRATVTGTVDRMVDAAHRETPGSIVDMARSTTALLMSVHAAESESEPEERKKILEKDLGQICGYFRQKDGLKDSKVAIAIGDILARLHPRNKHNEKQRLNLRPIPEEDATFAVSAIGLLLNELRWTYDTDTVPAPIADAGGGP